MRIDPNLPVPTAPTPGTTAWRPTVTSVTLTAYRRDVEHRPHGVGARRRADPERPRGHRRRRQRRRRRTRCARARSTPPATPPCGAPTRSASTPSTRPTPPPRPAAGTPPRTASPWPAPTPHSGIRDVTWRYQGGASTTGPGPATVTVSADGQHVLETMVTDNAGHTSGWKSHTVRIDKSAPQNQTPARPDGLAGRQLRGRRRRRRQRLRRSRGAVARRRRCHHERRLGPAGDGLRLGRPPVRDAGRGHGRQRVRLARRARADRHPARPSNTTATPTSPEDNPYTVAVTGTDAHSSIAAVEWRVDGGAPQTGAAGATATVTGNGAHTLETRVLDAAGNSSGWRTDSFTIDAVTGDATPPVDTTTTVSSTWRVSPVAITVSATDSGSGVERRRVAARRPAGAVRAQRLVHHRRRRRARARDARVRRRRQRLRLARPDDPRRPHGADRRDRPSRAAGTARARSALDATDAHSGVAGHPVHDRRRPRAARAARRPRGPRRRRDVRHPPSRPRRRRAGLDLGDRHADRRHRRSGRHDHPARLGLERDGASASRSPAPTMPAA